MLKRGLLGKLLANKASLQKGGHRFPFAALNMTDKYCRRPCSKGAEAGARSTESDHFNAAFADGEKHLNGDIDKLLIHLTAETCKLYIRMEIIAGMNASIP
jgi:hypothetical protein